MDTSLTMQPHPIGYTTDRLEYAGFLHRTPAGCGEALTRGPTQVLERAVPARVIPGSDRYLGLSDGAIGTCSAATSSDFRVSTETTLKVPLMSRT